MQVSTYANGLHKRFAMANKYNVAFFLCVFPPPFPTGEEAVPSWAFSMASATPEPTIFDLAAASAFVLGPSSTPAPPPTTSTPDPPPTTAKISSTSTSTSNPVPTTGATSQGTTTSARSVNSSAFLPSTVLPSSEGITPSHGPTLPSSPPVTTSASSGSTVPPTSISSQQDQLSTHRNSFPAGAIAGIAIGICLVIALANIGAWDSDAQIITTRQAAYPAPLSSAITSPDAPSVPSNASAWNDSQPPLVPIGRQHLRTESRAAQEKMDLNEEWDSSTSFAPASYPAERSARVLSTFSASHTAAAAPDPDMVDDGTCTRTGGSN
ncbi:hypothetical protein B0H19DRAFT_1071161 [Mycena capillaripes]|nr:hypothetical protein B0H19DRAFT_1071161 [Mycena capillaripes]